jgi:hypothetical protein
VNEKDDAVGVSVQSWVVSLEVTVERSTTAEVLRRVADRVGPFGSAVSAARDHRRIRAVVRLHAIDASSAAAVPLQRLGAELARAGCPIASVDAVEVLSAEEAERRGLLECIAG